MFEDLIKKEVFEEKEEDFINYVWSFYGENGLYEIKDLTIDEIIKAIRSRKLCLPDIDYNGDSYDRELTRDYILLNRGIEDLEHGHIIKKNL